MKKYLKPSLILLLIFFLGLFLRLYQLGTTPAGFHADEAAFGYNAYSIIETGKDEYGKTLPLVLKSFGDYKGALYAYLSIPFVLLFGLNPFGVRFASAIISALTIVVIYLFAKKLFNNTTISLVSAFLFAISPWDIIISRVTGDVEVGLFFTLLMSYLLLFLNEKKSSFYFVLALLFGFLATISYAPYRFYVILIPLIFLVFSAEKIKGKINFNKKVLFFIISIILVGIIYSFIAPTERLSQISIFTNQNTQLVLDEQVREDATSQTYVTRIFHNKVVNYTRTLLENAGQYFTLDYLFLNGGFPLRERIPASGLFYIWQSPFLLFGLYLIIRKKERSGFILIAWWIILLIPTIFTFDEIPNVHRNLIINPAILLIISIGIADFLKIRKEVIGKIALGVLIVVGLFEFAYFFHQYFAHQNVHRPWYRGFAYEELVSEVNKISGDYKKVIVTKGNQSPYIYFLFYSKYSPVEYQKQGSPRDLDYKGFDKYTFVPLGCPPVVKEKDIATIKGDKDTLYIDMGTCDLPANAKIIKTINWQDGSSAFKIIDFR